MYRCGEKIYNVRTNDERFNIVAPSPSIVRPNESHLHESFNVVLSYVSFDNMPAEVTENLINSLTEEENEEAFEFVGENAIVNSRHSLMEAISEADMFYRVGHVKGNSLNLSFTQGRELLFQKFQNGLKINLRIQVPLAIPTGHTALHREELAQAHWNRHRNGKEQSLFAMGIACRSASFINTWMDGYFEAAISHLKETLYFHLRNNEPPYRAESNLETPHSGLKRRINLVFEHGEEVIDRVYP